MVLSKSIISKTFKHNDAIQSFKKNSHFLNSICIMPPLKFPSQQHKEIPVLIVRAHIIYLLWSLVLSSLWILIGLLFNIAWSLTLKGVVSPRLLLRLQAFTILYAVGISIMSATYALSKWFYNLFLITNFRVIDMDYNTLNSTSWAEAPLRNIEDIEVKNTGLIESMFDVGDVFVQTAGHKDKIEIKRIPKPMKIQNILLELIQTIKKHG